LEGPLGKHLLRLESMKMDLKEIGWGRVSGVEWLRSALIFD
jgi:hypothetical protein